MVYQRQATARVLDALGDPTRRAVLEVLRGGAQPVGGIAKRLPVSRPAVSQHLRVLKEAGLVRDRKDGTRRLYSVDGAGLAALRAYLESYWGTALAAFKDAADAAADGSDADADPDERRSR
jgi:DNA-binding transcriptional ArsR family regulator